MFSSNSLGAAAQAGTGDRVVDLSVSFPSPFKEIPKVGLSLTGIDISSDNKFLADAVDATTAGFKIRLTAVGTSVLTAVQFSYIASVEAKSHIHIVNLKLDNTVDADFNAIHAPGADLSANRELPRTVNFGGSVASPRAIAAMASFGAQQGADITLEVNVNSFTANSADIKFRIWGNTVMNTVQSTIILYDTTKKSGFAQLTLPFGGALATGTGLRSYAFSTFIGTPFPVAP
mmetsp:Transcript_43539/g.60439  ORF Transcript_43539/g.60439 Transcript_43539/m.60439 type:complete len:232 (+) Transcript_43539:660-1355(+)